MTGLESAAETILFTFAVSVLAECNPKMRRRIIKRWRSSVVDLEDFSKVSVLNGRLADPSRTERLAEAREWVARQSPAMLKLAER